MLDTYPILEHLNVLLNTYRIPLLPYLKFIIYHRRIINVTKTKILKIECTNDGLRIVEALQTTTINPFIPSIWNKLYKPKENHTELVTRMILLHSYNC